MSGNPVPVRTLPRPYLIFVGDEQHRSVAKTGAGVCYWAPEACTGQWRLSPAAINLGLALTVKALIEDHLRFFAAGFDAALIKPLSLERSLAAQTEEAEGAA